MEGLTIETHQLNFSFGSRQVLSSLNLQVPKGSIYCLLGPNGAGKTTTIRILLGLLKVRQAEINLFGLSANSKRIAISRRTGSLIEQPSLYSHLTGIQNLEVMRLAYDCPSSRIKEVLGITGISYAGHELVRTYSQGMKQRLGIAIALLHDPELLILDEPTNGLDPHGIIEIRELLIRLQAEFGKTIFLSSHLLSEVEKIASHLGIIHQGRLIYQGSDADLRQRRSIAGIFELQVGDADAACALLFNNFEVKKISDFVIQISRLNKETSAIVVETVVKNDILVYKAGFLENSLEDFFLKITAP